MTIVCDSKKETEKFLWYLTGRDGFELTGEKCLHTWVKNPETNLNQSYFYYSSELDKAADDAQRMSGEYHVYVGMGYRNKKLPSTERGKKADIAGIPCLWVEVDVKGGTHKETNLPETKAEAIEMVKNLLISFPPNCIVDSGGGIYAYWFFDKPWIFENDIEREAAHNLNTNLLNALKLKANEKGWKVDTVSDLPRTLRLPGTKNIKDPNNIRTARIVESTDMFYTVEEMKKQLPDDVKPEIKRKGTVARKQKEIPNNVPVQKEDYPPAHFDLIKSKCGFIAHCVDDAADLTEPEWYAAITIVSRCENGEELCHRISENYPGYSEEETELKIEHALADTGPMSCSHIATTLTNEYCKKCRYRGKIVSPIKLGTCTDFIDELNTEYAVVLVGGKCCILRETVEPIFRRPDINLMSFPDFHNWFANRTVLHNKRIMPISKVWETSKKRRQYNGIIFNPAGEEEGHYNLWRGFAVDPIEGDCSLYLDHIRSIIAGGDEEIYQWILAWMSRLIQNPGGQKPGTSIVLRGKQGTGKGVFVKYFGEIIGSHFIQINNQNQLTGHFNSHLKDALLVYCDEAIWGGNKDAEGVLKGMVTEDTIMVEAKGKDSYPVKNHINIIVASNNEWCVPAGLEERRFMVLDVNDTSRGNGEYFKNICDQMENGGCEALHHYLLNFDISKINLRKIPRTEALLDQIMHSMDPFKKWWLDALQRGGFYGEDDEKKVIFMPWDVPQPTKALYDSYKLTSKDINGKNHLGDAQFGKSLKKICKKIFKKKHSNLNNTYYSTRDVAGYYYLPSLIECRHDFEISIDMENKIEWPIENDLNENDTEEAQSANIPVDSSSLQDDVMVVITI